MSQTDFPDHSPDRPPGSAPVTWVLLRGLTRDARHWGDFPGLLQAAFPEARLVLLDLPGNGALHHLRSPADVPAMADFAREALRRQGVPPPYHLLAMSLGGMVATEWAQRHPDELAGMVLVTTSLSPPSRFWQRLRPSQWPRLLGMTLRSGKPLAWERQVLRMTSNRHQRNNALLARWAEWRRTCPVSSMNALRQLLAAARYRALPSAPAVPVLLLGSWGDRLVHPSCSLQLAQRWGCPVVMHPDAGHDLPLDDGGWVVGQVEARWATSVGP